ncbi:MAG: insulinase family protein [Chlamydiota bacterium]
MQLISPYKKGQTLFNYVFKKIIVIEELQCIFYELEHLASGAKVLHLANDDDENLFCLGFQTLPKNSNGVIHILEHTVLCGSKKYPVKDPFFGMTRRSLNTFMNALTGSDFTCYPAASQVPKDFYNLLDVYLDAVFNPLLKRFSFLQEGCRIEFEEPENPKSPLVYRGIVFNEMKGSLSSAENRLWQLIHTYLTPDLPYAYNSGGDPKEIPSLTYEEFCEFHKTNYDPSRCLFYFYGNLPLEDHLTFLETHVLKDVKPTSEPAPIPLKKRFTHPLHKEASYPTHEKDLSHKTMVSFSWLTAPIKEQQDVLALSLIDSILFDTDASPLRFALLQSKLCRQVDALIDLEMSEIPMTVICKGCEAHNADKLQKVIFQTLEELAEKGFDQETIDSSLHQLEFAGMEIGGDYYPFGLNLFFRVALAKFHGCMAEESLLIHSQFTKLLKLTKDPTYLPGLIRKYLLNNPHFTRIIMTPSLDLAQEESEEELEKLATIKKHLKESDIKKILQETKELEAFQKEIEQHQLDCLPKIALCDVPKKTKIFHLDKLEKSGFTLYHHECFTNHIAYVNFVFSLPHLTEEELLYSKLFTLLFAEMGTKTRDYMENLEELHAYTGGVGCSLGIHPQHNFPHILKPALHLKGKALSRNISHLFRLMQEMMTSIDFNVPDRIKEMFLQISTEQLSRLNKNALSYATSLSCSNNSLANHLNYLWNGLKFYTFIQDLAKDLDKNIPTIIKNLESLKHKLFHFHNLDITLSCNAHDKAVIEKADFFGLGDLEKKPYTPWHFDIDKQSITSQARKISTPVAFTCMSCSTIHTPHPLAPAMSLASSIMQHVILHKKIRELGGAYGAGASYNGINGNFQMHAYRDPHIASTIEAFKEAINMIAAKEFSERDLEEAKLSVIQQIDSPITPGGRATDAYNLQRENIFPESRQIFRGKILNATSDEVAEAVKLHLSHFAKDGHIVVFAGEDLLKKENAFLETKLPILSI